MDSYPHRIFTAVKLNDHYSMKMKVDTGADISVLTTVDLQQLPLSLDIEPCHSVLKSYGGAKIENMGATFLKVSFNDNSTYTKFNIVEAPENPSMIGCKQSQELGIVIVNIHDVTMAKAHAHTIHSSEAKQAAQQGKLSKSTFWKSTRSVLKK